MSPVNFTDKVVVLGPDAPITCGGVELRPVDAILADWDGVVVIPQKKAATVLGEVLVKEKAERTIRERIREAAGGSPLADIFAEFE